MPFVQRIILLTALAVAIALSATTQAHADWRRAETENFVIYSDTGEGELREFARKVQRFHGVLRTFYPVTIDTIPPKLEIYVVNGNAEMQKVVPGIGSGIGGFYSASENRIYAVVDRRSGNGDNTLFHEYTHHFMQHYLPGPYPAWFVEGFAEYYATVDMNRSRSRVGLFNPGRMNSLTGQFQWVPMEDLLASRTSQLQGSQIHIFYAQAWALTSYLYSTPERTKGFGAYLQALGRGIDPITALDGTIDMTPRELEDAVRSYLGRGLPLRDVPSPEDAVDVRVTSLPRSANDLLLAELRASANRVSDEDAPAFLAEVTAASARYPGDAIALVALAEAQLQAEQPAAAQATLAPLVEGPDANPDALRLTGEILIARYRDMEDQQSDSALTLRNQARRLLARSLDADPFDFRTYLALDDTRRSEATYPDDNDLQLLSDAATLAPQVTSVRYRAAQGFLARDLPVQAIALLVPVANDPHGGERLKPVRTLLSQARQKAGLESASESEADLPPDADEGAEPPDADHGGEVVVGAEPAA